jgi:hypothetical protein
MNQVMAEVSAERESISGDERAGDSYKSKGTYK